MVTHKDLEFAVDDVSGHQRTFKKFADACEFAVSVSMSSRPKVHIDVLVWSKGAAKAWGRNEAVYQYEEDPEASVFQRITITATDMGRVP